ncbi:MAG: 3-deoxy-D-manno-octulosonic acid transferase [Chlamydiia bacterium]|nr:3-deoxy-D-manno-octulosonic acid transferase [Chlamydiia bacterium]
MPKVLFQRFSSGKYKKSLPFKLGLKFPNFSKVKPSSIWIHAGSVGETKAAIAFAKLARESLPDSSIVFSTTTETGLDEVKRSMSFLDEAFYLPYDFSWILKKYFKRLNPRLLVLVESDLWPNLLNIAKQSATKTLLINGRLSEKSLKRHILLKSFSKKLFKDIDMCCIQNDEYLQRFLKIGINESKLKVCGNLKFDTPIKVSSPNEIKKLKAKLGILPQHRVITIGSTHHNEEKLLLQAIEPLLRSDHNLKVILVPRHPERFIEVEKYLHEHHRQYLKYSNADALTGYEKILLIDAMGMLGQCYEISDVAIVAGSYVNIGGHNLLEPIEYGVPVVFGPYIHAQKELARLVIDAEVGQKKELSTLADTIRFYLYSENAKELFDGKCKLLLAHCRGSSKKCWIEAEKLLKCNQLGCR